MFVVVGATGNTGSAVVKTLLGKKQPVRIVVRSTEKGSTWEAKGAEVVVASLDDVSALAKAFEGATGIYLMIPPNYAATAWLSDQQVRLDRAAEAVQKSGAGHVAFLSSIGGQLPDGTGPIRAVHYGEGKLRASVRHLTILRSPYFMENWTPVVGAVKAEGVLPTFIAPQAKIPMISTKDIGRIAAEHLIAGGRGKQIVEMAGPEEYSPEQVATALGQILGKTVTAQHAPLSAVVPTFKSFGFSDEAARLFEEMYTAFSKGLIRYEQPVRLVRGTVTLQDALQEMVK
ncbi:MAG: NAD-dependent dehydratase [Candidatus Nitrospira kreftii]|uniref:NAD-dependent dehydratase n=1 Tax=Candidatus Nitrospira kreftii TaxID=2652173 RepID=A0A7S8FGU8_9BACT|nr:MAG: NAD-dependent dehydratase [Candidatus Nitrospira kreftii]